MIMNYKLCYADHKTGSHTQVTDHLFASETAALNSALETAKQRIKEFGDGFTTQFNNTRNGKIIVLFDGTPFSCGAFYLEQIDEA